VNLLARIAVPAAVVCLLASTGARAQSSDGLNHDRILGVIPNYQTVNDATPATPPLTPKQKWLFFLDETRDPFNIFSEALSAALSQADNQTPKYGEGGVAYAKRFGAAVGDFGSRNLFSDALLACLLHQDPRYFRKGPQARLLPRIAYSLSRIAVARQDSGRQTFNASGFFGMMLGIGASNLYYPSASRTGTVMAVRLGARQCRGGILARHPPEVFPERIPEPEGAATADTAPLAGGVGGFACLLGPRRQHSYSIASSRSFASTCRPGCTSTWVTFPPTGAYTVLCIFMASITNRRSPFFTG
jgi:hypothetical protein